MAELDSIKSLTPEPKFFPLRQVQFVPTGKDGNSEAESTTFFGLPPLSLAFAYFPASLQQMSAVLGGWKAGKTRGPDLRLIT